MPPGHVLPGDHHVAPGLPPEDQRRPGDRVLPPVGKTHHPAAGVGGRLPDAAPGLRHGFRHLHRRDVLRTAAAALVYEGQLVSRHLHLVPMQQRSRLGTQPHPVDHHLGLRDRFADHHLAVGQPLQHRVAWQQARPGKGNGTAGVASQRHLARRDRESLPVELALIQIHPKKAHIIWCGRIERMTHAIKFWMGWWCKRVIGEFAIFTPNRH